MYLRVKTPWNDKFIAFQIQKQKILCKVTLSTLVFMYDILSEKHAFSAFQNAPPKFFLSSLLLLL